MLPEKEKEYAKLFLDSLENGSKPIPEIRQFGEQIDPIYVYFVFRYLREKHQRQPQSEGVLNRLVQISSESEKLVKMARQGEKDLLREWFDDSHSMREFFGDSDKFLELIYDKINS